MCWSRQAHWGHSFHDCYLSLYYFAHFFTHAQCCDGQISSALYSRRQGNAPHWTHVRTLTLCPHCVQHPTCPWRFHSNRHATPPLLARRLRSVPSASSDGGISCVAFRSARSTRVADSAPPSKASFWKRPHPLGSPWRRRIVRRKLKLHPGDREALNGDSERAEENTGHRTQSAWASAKFCKVTAPSWPCISYCVIYRLNTIIVQLPSCGIQGQRDVPGNVSFVWRWGYVL